MVLTEFEVTMPEWMCQLWREICIGPIYKLGPDECSHAQFRDVATER